MRFFFLLFRPYFHYCLSSAHYCEDHFHSCLYPQFKYMTFIYSYLFRRFHCRKNLNRKFTQIQDQSPPNPKIQIFSLVTVLHTLYIFFKFCPQELDFKSSNIYKLMFFLLLNTFVQDNVLIYGEEKLWLGHSQRWTGGAENFFNISAPTDNFTIMCKV